MTDLGEKTCLGCHGPVKEELARPVNHTATREGQGKGKACLSCHSPHAGDDAIAPGAPGAAGHLHRLPRRGDVPRQVEPPEPDPRLHDLPRAPRRDASRRCSAPR